MKAPEYMISAYQTSLRTTTPDKKINIAILYNLDLRMYYIEIDGKRHPRDGISINYTENDYIDQYSILNVFFKKIYRRTIKKSSFIISRHENKIP